MGAKRGYRSGAKSWRFEVGAAGERFARARRERRVGVKYMVFVFGGGRGVVFGVEVCWGFEVCWRSRSVFVFGVVKKVREERDEGGFL